jgi:hypothetical protein
MCPLGTFYRTSLLALSFIALTFAASSFTRVSAQTSCAVCISEFRSRGLSKFDEFIEIYNNSDSPVTVNNGGWAVETLGPGGGLANVFTIPAGTVIPARGHYLAANNNGDQNNNGYSMFDYATADLNYGSDVRDNGGLAIFNNATTFTLATRFDAVGFASAGNTANAQLLREGTGLLGNFGNSDNTPNTNVQYSFVRKFPTAPGLTSAPVDTNNNASDFLFISTTAGMYGGLNSILGLPGPENLASPVSMLGPIASGAYDPTVGLDASPNRQRTNCPAAPECNPDTAQLGTLTIRRNFKNNTGRTVTRLRFRIVDITTINNRVAGDADVRLLDSGSELPPSGCGGSCGQSNGSKLERSQSQAKGGGLNSSTGASSGAIDLSTTPLAPGASINVRFVLGVQQIGNFRFYISADANTTP